MVYQVNSSGLYESSRHNELPHAFLGVYMDLKDVNDIASLSQLLQIKKQDLTYILYRIQPSNCYTQFEIPKKKWWSKNYQCST